MVLPANFSPGNFRDMPFVIKNYDIHTKLHCVVVNYSFDVLQLFFLIFSKAEFNGNRDGGPILQHSWNVGQSSSFEVNGLCENTSYRYVVIPGKGILTLLKRVAGMCGGKDPLFTLPQLLHKTSFSSFFSSA